MSNDTLSDSLTMIRNAQAAGHKQVSLRSVSATKDLLNVLKSEGFIESYATKSAEAGSFDKIEVFLKYMSTGEPVISSAVRMSKPGRRFYCGWENIPHVKNGLGIAVVSTSEGVMSDREARRRKVGGEIWALVG